MPGDGTRLDADAGLVRLWCGGSHRVAPCFGDSSTPRPRLILQVRETSAKNAMSQTRDEDDVRGREPTTYTLDMNSIPLVAMPIDVSSDDFGTPSSA